MTGTQGAVPIPPLQYHDEPLDVNLRVRPANGYFELEIRAYDQTLGPFEIELTPADLGALNRTFRVAMEGITTAVGKGKTGPDLEGHLRPLVETGSHAFGKAFADPQAAKALGDLLAESRPLVIAVVTENFFVPWELFYPEQVGQVVSYEQFIGMRHLISRSFVTHERPAAWVSTTIPVTKVPKVGLAAYDRLRAVREAEIPFFRDLKDKGNRIDLQLLERLNAAPKEKVAQLKVLEAFCGSGLQVAHFACEAQYKESTPDQSVIMLTKEFPLLLRDMDVYCITMTGYPLVILNGCETSDLNPAYTAHFAAAFWKHGARAVVATECKISDAFAARFSQRLYQSLLAGRTVGESLLEARQHFLKTEGHPAGAFYSLYGPHTVRLECP